MKDLAREIRRSTERLADALRSAAAEEHGNEHGIDPTGPRNVVIARNVGRRGSHAVSARQSVRVGRGGGVVWSETTETRRTTVGPDADTDREERP